MKNEINVNSNMLTWAIARAGFEWETFTKDFPNVQKWLAGDKKPTVKQLEAFSKKVQVR